MSYYYIHPFKPQFFFPKNFKQKSILCSFYKPYTLSGTISWWLFKNINFYRILFEKNCIETYIPEQEIRRILGNNALMAFNTGTPGPEQKITAIGVVDQDEFFIKYAQTSISRKNVINEYYILNQLAKLNFVPKVRSFYKDASQVLLQTSVLKGRRLGISLIDESILKCLIAIVDCKVATNRNYLSSGKTSFAHGDFCPWNMMSFHKKILIYDWEMAGNYPFGYDLFTYMFQTNFLIHSKKSNELIINENINFIVKYFSHFEIKNWKEFLVAFAQTKIQLEDVKETKELVSKYKGLLKYARTL